MYVYGCMRLYKSNCDFGKLEKHIIIKKMYACMYMGVCVYVGPIVTLASWKNKQVSRMCMHVCIYVCMYVCVYAFCN